MRKILIITGKAICVGLLALQVSGCAILVPLSGLGGPNVPYYDRAPLTLGQPRKTVLDTLGDPYVSLRDGVNRRVESYLLKEPFLKKTRIEAAGRHLLRDVVTFGLWDFYVPRYEQGIVGAHVYLVTLHYSPADTIAKVCKKELYEESSMEERNVELKTERCVYYANRQLSQEARQALANRWEQCNASEETFLKTLRRDQLLLYSDIEEATQQDNKAKVIAATNALLQVTSREQHEQLYRLWQERRDIIDRAQVLSKEKQKLEQYYAALKEKSAAFADEPYQERQSALAEEQEWDRTVERLQDLHRHHRLERQLRELQQQQRWDRMRQRQRELGIR